MEMTQNITKQILKMEEAAKKDSCKWPFFLVEVFNFGDFFGPSFFH